MAPANKRIFLSPPHMSGLEQQFVLEAFAGNYIAPLGAQLDAFEKEFIDKTGITNAVALSSGTAAMHLALRALGIGPGDEVITSTLTFIGSVSPVTFLGGFPVFVDSDRKTWNMDPDLLEEVLAECQRVGRLPKAVIPTEIYGQCCDLDRIQQICKPYGIPVIVDSAESLGSIYRGRPAGNGSRAAIYSFNGNKIITTSSGGMLASDDEDLIAHARKLSQQAREPLPHYEHLEIGYNYRMSNILAAIGRGQLQVLEERVERKRQIFDFYRQSLEKVAGIELMPEAPYGKSNRWLTAILIDQNVFGVDRDTVRLALESENIETRPVWKPMHLQPVFNTEKKDSVSVLRFADSPGQAGKHRKDTYRARIVRGGVAEDLFNRGLCLPSGTAMTEEDLNRVVSAILRCRKS